MIEGLFNNYFEKEKAPSDIAMLLEVAKKAGLTGVTEATLKNPELVRKVQQEMREVRDNWEVRSFLLSGLDVLLHFLT